MDYCLKNVEEEREALIEKRRNEIKAKMVQGAADNKASITKYLDQKYSTKQEVA